MHYNPQTKKRRIKSQTGSLTSVALFIVVVGFCLHLAKSLPYRGRNRLSETLNSTQMFGLLLSVRNNPILIVKDNYVLAPGSKV